MDEYIKRYKEYIDFLHMIRKELNFFWLRPDEMNIIENYKKKDWGDNGNPFLKSTQNNKIKLAESVLEYGVIFPMFSKDIDGEHYIILGNHRARALKMIGTNKKFLTISLPHTCFKPDSFNSDKSMMLKKLRNYPNLINPKAFKNLGSDFKPFSGFNEKSDFERWINNVR